MSKPLLVANIWSDIFTVGAIVRMWNISITIISPTGNDVWKIHHNMDVPDVVIAANGDAFGSNRAATHFSSTEYLSNASKIVPSDKANQDNYRLQRRGEMSLECTTARNSRRYCTAYG